MYKEVTVLANPGRCTHKRTHTEVLTMSCSPQAGQVSMTIDGT